MLQTGTESYDYRQSTNLAPTASAFGTLAWCPFWPAILLIAFFVPTEFSFNLGPLRLTPYRLILIVSFLPALLRLFSGKAGPLNSIDFFLGVHLLWAYVVFGVHHGVLAAFESGGIRMLEIGGGYLLARAFITGEREFRGFFAMLGVLLVLLAPIVIFESVTGIFPIKYFSTLVTGNEFFFPMETRGGFDRAVGSFDHPILLGVFAASGLSILWGGSFPRVGHPRVRRLAAVAAVGAALSSVSAGAVVVLGVQLALLFWASRTQHIHRRWGLLLFLVIAFYVSIELLSNRSGINVLLHYFTFDAHNAFYRLAIFDWGMINVWANPIFGIGFNDWVRADWMTSSMDNLWLLQAVTFGIPGFITFTLPFVIMGFSGWGRHSPRLGRLRTEWTIALISLIIAGCTVHFWNNLIVYFFFFLGAGNWFLNVNRKDAGDPSEQESS